MRNFLEYLVIANKYYHNRLFCKVDHALRVSYLFDNPFAISKKFLKKRGAEDIYSYGETPLPSWEKIAKECVITSADTLYDLGCGRGQLCFWSSIFIPCKVVGIEQVPEFVNKAKKIVSRYHIKEISFIHADYLEYDLRNATVIYLFGTCLKEVDIQRFIDQCKTLKPGTKIITVSYSLTDYAPKTFEVMKRFSVAFAWGHTDVYLQVVKRHKQDSLQT